MEENLLKINLDFNISNFYHNENQKVICQIENQITELDQNILIIDEQLADKDFDIEIFQNNMSKLDLVISISSGFVAAIINRLYSGKFDLKEGEQWSEQKMNSFVKDFAKANGYKGDSLEGSIRHLEKKFGLASDSVTSAFGGGLQHHLRDFSHHFSLIGLFFSLLTQFTGLAYGTNKLGAIIVLPIEDKKFIGKTVGEKIAFGTIGWLFHLASDVAGSSGSIGKGTGIPGPILSLIKLLGSLPIFKEKDGVYSLSLFASKLFNGTLLAEKDEKGKILSKTAIHQMDFRGELAVFHQLGKQALSVCINEIIIRVFYFISRLCDELKTKKLKDVDVKKVMPFNNGTIKRMLTISSGIFLTLNTVDALIESALCSGGSWITFGKDVLCRINFPNLGRFIFALGADIRNSIDKYKLVDNRNYLNVEKLYLMNAKISYNNQIMWIASKDTTQSLLELQETIREIGLKYQDDISNIDKLVDEIKKINIETIKEKNDELVEELIEILN